LKARCFSTSQLEGIHQLKEACSQALTEDADCKILSHSQIDTLYLGVHCAATAELLRRLWTALQPWQSNAQAPRQCPGRKHAAWKSIGFQAETPLTDVRSAGLLGLQLLVQVAEQWPAARELAHASSTQYPFCAAVLDSSFMICAALKLLPSTPTFCPALGTGIREPDSGTRRDLQGFLALVQASDAPITVLRE